jgi:hypothetical protein
LIERSRPVFLVEAEDRHRERATASIFEFFDDRGYDGFFIEDGDIMAVEEFNAKIFQDPTSLLPNGGRKAGRAYINNFFFFPAEKDGLAILSA